MKYGVTEALIELRPGAKWIVNGEVYSGIEWLDSGQTKPTEEEVNAKITALDNAEAERLLRIERNMKISQSDWRVTKAKETSTNIPTAWKTYRQALRDLPASTTPTLDSNYNLDPSSVTWPTEPS